MTPERPRFPIWLTVASLVAFAICCGLGVWQMQRADWKTQQLARIAEMKTAPAQPIAPVLAHAARGADVSLTRVAADCAPGPAQAASRISSQDGQWVTRPLAACRFAAAPYDGIVVDRGVLAASRGQVNFQAPPLPSPGHVVGVLRPPVSGAVAAGLTHPAPWIVAVEQETPRVPGVTPAPGEIGAEDNLQYVGAYTITWFGLAGTLAAVYAAMLWRRYRPKR
jgi:surfeit locus 1 family protein